MSKHVCSSTVTVEENLLVSIPEVNLPETQTILGNITIKRQLPWKSAYLGAQLW